MVKRAKSPSAADGAKYFTVYQPYPIDANWELPHDYISFARWIAGCIGPEQIFAFHHKPRSRGMIILEIDENCPNIDRLLGEHRWKDFLKNPTKDELDRVSQIFYSFYDNGRAAQKDGWKRVHAEDHWFRMWNLDNAIIRNPYPETYWCPIPPEDKTNKNICRHLPTSVKKPPDRVGPPVVGSEVWVNTKLENPDSDQTPNSSTKDNTNNGQRTRNTNNTKIKTNNTTKRPASNTSKSSSVPIQNAWNTPVTSSPNTSASATSPSGSSIRSPWSSVSSPTKSNPLSSVVPPGLNVRPPPVPAPPVSPYPDAPPGIQFKTNRMVVSNPAGSSNTAQLLEEFVGPNSSSQKATFYSPHDMEDDEFDPDDIGVEYMNLNDKPITQDYTTDEGVVENENLWDKDTSSKQPKVDLICPMHGTLCKKGVCRDMAKLVREAEKKKKDAERAAAKKAKKEKEAAEKAGLEGLTHGSDDLSLILDVKSSSDSKTDAASSILTHSNNGSRWKSGSSIASRGK